MKAIYPWNDWFSRREFRVVAGEDYLTSQWSMAGQIRVEAWKRKLRVKIEDEITGLRVQVVGKAKKRKARAAS